MSKKNTLRPTVMSKNSTHNGVVLCGYSLIQAITPESCLEAVMAAAVVIVFVANNAAAIGIPRSLLIDLLVRLLGVFENV